MEKDNKQTSEEKNYENYLNSIFKNNIISNVRFTKKEDHKKDK